MSKTVIISGESLGSGSDELGRQLMGSFLRKLWALPDKPASIVFYNTGVRLLAEGSGVLDALAGLSEAGVDLVACGTCVNYLNLKDKMVAGRVSNMSEIAATLLSGNQIVTV